MPRRPVRSPLPQRGGLDAVWVRTPTLVGGEPLPWATLGAFLRARLPDLDVAGWLAEGRFVDGSGRPITGAEPCTPATFVWFHKDLPAERELVAGDLTVLYRDDRIVVIDKPHFLATTPRGVHVRQTALVRLRVQLGVPDLAPAHRLDRLTAGVLVFTTAPRWRRPYQDLFAERLVEKTYEARAPAALAVGEERLVRSHVVKRAGSLQAVEVPDAVPNAETLVRLVEATGAGGGCGGVGGGSGRGGGGTGEQQSTDPAVLTGPDAHACAPDGAEGMTRTLGRYELRPRTGRTHQLRVHLNSLGAPILNDPLYPVVRAEAEPAREDPTRPLQLIARELAFDDPVDGTPRRFVSRIDLASAVPNPPQ